MCTPAIRVLAAVAALAAAIVVWFSLGDPNSAGGAPLDDSKFVAGKSLADDGRIGKVSDAQGVIGLRPMLAERWTPVCRETLLKPGDWLRADIRGANAVKIRFTSDVELTLGPGTLIECISPTQARIHSGEAQVSVPEPQQGKAKKAAADQGRENKVRDNKDKDNHEKANNAKEPNAGAANAGQSLAFELLAPRSGSRTWIAPGKVFLRVDRNQTLVEVKQLPKWLAGFESTASNESLGSLIVRLPDGRNEPLSVGYHKVSVEIRDQIARTTIEESFVNHTEARLEGVFHFPLPQDASISGFGMWIGNDLVEADIVEKQRAREIYETILREKRDPGLLEWTSGNLFKARVFPIEARSEKRVKIVYTQVLPLRANKYRYAYGLRSDLLRMKRVRELSLKVTVDSAIPLKSVTCATHAARTQQTDHAAQVEFSAQEYSPDRDFEVVCEIDGKQSDVVVVPHRRGGDGYLLVQLTPPGSEANWQREVLPDGAPLNVVLLCDTSGSMDSEKRKQQAEFVATVLASLGEKDRFMLAATDVSTAWAAPEPLAPTAENIARTRDFLERRTSLGWTNLDQAFAAALRKAPAGAQVVYLGDGIVCAGDREPASFVKRLAKLWAERQAEASSSIKKQADGVVLHAVTVGNTSESVVMQGIASVGGGSARAIGGEQTAQMAALELLNEIARPGLRELNIEFRGVKVAAVYPDRLPNLAAGMQQILVGRYLPEGNGQALEGNASPGNGLPQRGEIVVTGKRGGEPVRYSAQINFQDAEQGNSFIPRLWARSHLNHLLAQGSSATIRDDIIGLSEEFHIITPYTSLLVLETDADRERFGVKRRYGMRDGERFFAAGKDNANFELAQQQIKRAADWRLGLRRRILRELAGLGRDASVFEQQAQLFDDGDLSYYIDRATEITFPDPSSSALSPRGGKGLPLTLEELGQARGLDQTIPIDVYATESVQDRATGYLLNQFVATTIGPSSWDDVGGPGTVADFRTNLSLVISQTPDVSAGPISEAGEYMQGERFPGRPNGRMGGRSAFAGYGEPDANNMALGFNRIAGPSGGEFDEIVYGVNTIQSRRGGNIDGVWGGEWGRDLEAARGLIVTDSPRSSESDFSRRLPLGMSLPYGPEQRQRELGNVRSNVMDSTDYAAWLRKLFPMLAAPPSKPAAPREPAETWTPAAIALSQSLSRLDSLSHLTAGIELHVASDSFDPNWKRTTAHSGSVTLYSLASWLNRPINTDSETSVDFCDKQQRGVFSLAFLLGQSRASVERDLATPPFALRDWSMAPLHEVFRPREARVEPAGEDQSKLILRGVDATRETHLLIDKSKHVLLKCEVFDDGKSTGATSFSDFVEVAGSWWAKRQVSTDAQGRKIRETTLEITPLEQDPFDARMKAELAILPTVQFLPQSMPRLKDARQRVADGSATFGDRIVMMIHDTQLQQWDDLLKQLDEAEKLAAGKPGMRRLRTVIYSTIRRNEEARGRLLDEANQLVAKPQADELFLAEFVLEQLQQVSGPDEFLRALEVLTPVFERQQAASSALEMRLSYVANAYLRAGRMEDYLAASKAWAENAPWDVYGQVNYARQLSHMGQTDAALAWLDKQLARPEHDANSADYLRNAYVDLYRQHARWRDLLEFTTAWIARKPESMSPYQQHLSALIDNDQLDAANTLAEQWLQEACVEGKLAPDQRARLDAAIALGQGSTYHQNFYGAQQRWFEPLAEAARFFARHRHHLDAARRIMTNPFTESEECNRLRANFLGLLQTDSEKLSPEQVNFLVENTLAGRLEFAAPVSGRKQMDASELPAEIWKKIADDIRARWEKTTDQPGQYDKHSLGETLRLIYMARFADTELAPFLRERIKVAIPRFKDIYIATLFQTLLVGKWTDDVEIEAFQILRQLSAPGELAVTLTVQAAALYRLVDGMLASRLAVALQALRDQGNVDQLTRAQLAEKLVEFRKAARIGVAKRLTAAATQAIRDKSPLADWLLIEQSTLDVQIDQNVDQTLALCWSKLGEAPPKHEPEAAVVDAADESISPAQALQKVLDSLLRQRALALTMNIAAQKGADPQAVDQLLKYIDAGIAHGGDGAAPWRHVKFQLLLALDRPDDLQRELRDWIRADVSTAPWRQSLALLVAERGKLDEAIQLFESAQKDRLLTAADYRTLAIWYQVRNRRDDYERAKLESFQQMPENNLSQIIYSAHNQWQSHGDRPLPSELDESVLLAFKALFAKSTDPGNYVNQLQQLYAACRDFRLLQMTPDATLGHSPEQVYPLLRQVRDSLLHEMRNEAAADEIVARIKALRQGDRTPDDLRALDLLEAMVERQSAEVQNQRGPHVAACLAALRRAFERKWSAGEPRLMAEFVSGLGALPDQTLQDEQLRELRELQKAVPADSRDQLLITADLCRLLFRHYDRRTEAMQTLASAIGGYEQAQQGQLPYEDDHVLDEYVSMLQDSGQHAAGEIVLQKHRKQSQNEAQRTWLQQRLWSLYNHALDHQGEVSLGKSKSLLPALIAYGRRQIGAAPDENVRYDAVNRLVETFEIAYRHRMAGIVEPLRKFAFDDMPAILSRQQRQYQRTATGPISTIVNVLGKAAELRYVVERMEQWPQRLQMSSYENAWQALGQPLAYARTASVKDPAAKPLQPRVLKLVVAELKRFLRTNENANQALFSRRYSDFWAERTDDFAKAANQVYEERKTSGRRVMQCARYLRDGLDLRARANEILLIANKDGLLDVAARRTLAQYLQQDNRYAESIPLLEPLAQELPDDIQLRTELMTAYFHSQRPARLTAAVQQVELHFHAGGRWTEDNMGEFAKACAACGMHEKAIGYYNEAIAAHQRANPRSSLGDEALSKWYQQLAWSHDALGQTKAAVDAAAAAIVCWSPRQTERAMAIAVLRGVLQGAKDLDAYIEQRDVEASASGQDSPLVRKAIGQVYQNRGDHAKAIAQFQIARQLQADDKESCQSLIAYYDALRKPREATEQLLALIDFDRHDLKLYEQLADRFKNDESEAERAATSIIEAGPTEAENHQSMARLRERQNRWNDAMAEWTEVAELRRLEPTGLLGLAAAQLHQKQWAGLRQTLDKLQKTDWPTRFESELQKTDPMRRQLPAQPR